VGGNRRDGLRRRRSLSRDRDLERARRNRVMRTPSPHGRSRTPAPFDDEREEYGVRREEVVDSGDESGEDLFGDNMER
jgi:hypothetical protein